MPHQPSGSGDGEIPPAALAHLVADEAADQRIETAMGGLELLAMGAADVEEALR